MTPVECTKSVCLLLGRSELRSLRISGLRLLATSGLARNSWIFRCRGCSTTTTTTTTTTPTHDAPDCTSSRDIVTLEYVLGLPYITVPLPSRQEQCRFALKPVTHKVGDLITMLKAEDHGIDRATILNKSGIRIASTSNVESLLDEPFWLHINDQRYQVIPPIRKRITDDDIKRMGDIKALVAQLYEALNVGEFHVEKEQELTTKLEELKYQVAPLENQKNELTMQASRRVGIFTWIGLGLMSMQFGILARLTWWEYSWDIMEPVTYFVTYGTAMACYAYYCLTKQEYVLADVRDRGYLLTVHKRAKKKNFDIERYNGLKRQIADIEYDLRRLRDPLNLQLPPHIDRSQRNVPPPSTPSPPPAPPSPPPAAAAAAASLSTLLMGQMDAKTASRLNFFGKK